MTVTPVPQQTGPWKNARIGGRISEVDGLRGVAIVLVLLFHYITATNTTHHPLWTLVTVSTHLFASGVDLFFVLSGFLIAGILMDSASSNSYFQTFYQRRLHRIFPLYFGWLALFYLGILFNIDAAIGGHIFRGSIPLWFYPLFLQNNAPLWFNSVAPLWMAMSWSLAVEEQFYVVLPTVVRLVSTTTMTWLCGATIVLSPMYRYWLVAGTAQLSEGWPFSTLARLDGLAMGVAAALLVRNAACWQWLNRHLGGFRISALLLFLGCVALTYSAPSDLSMALYGFSVVTAFYAVVLLIVLCQPASWLAAWLRIPVFQYFGRVSYSVYIFHQGIRGLVDKLMPGVAQPFKPARAAAVIGVAATLTVLLAELSWRLVERRLIKRAHVRYKY
jgi:peptidoglycan/LPS O-acetylase OafA/YrhL